MNEDELFDTPIPVSEVPDVVARADVDEDSEPEEDTLPKEFNPKYRNDLHGLTYLGKLEHTFDWMGHRFRIKTPTIDETLEVAVLHKPFVNTVGDAKAFQALMCAACIVSVDGKPLPVPMGEEETRMEARFNFIKASWYPWTLDKIWDEWAKLDARVVEIIDAIGRASGDL